MTSVLNASFPNTTRANQMSNMDANTNFLVTGAGRGLGRGLVEALLLRPGTTVIAATRSQAPTAAAALNQLPVHPGNRLISITIDSQSPSDALQAADVLFTEHQVRKLDVVIANAGIGKPPTPALETRVQEIQDCFTVNTIAPLLLYQAMWPLLEKAPSPKFVVISSIAASLGEVPRYASPCAAYGVSKAAVNFLARRIGAENERLVAVALHPGWVQSDMGNAAAVRLGITEAPVEVSRAVHGILEEIELATRETSDAFRTFDHQELPW